MTSRPGTTIRPGMTSRPGMSRPAAGVATRATAGRAIHARGPAGSRAGRPRSGAERGSGSVLAMAVLGAIVTLTLLLVPVLGLLVALGQLRTAADAGALAAADTASGLLAGVPCDAAHRAATLNGAHLTGCTVDGLIATVTVTRLAGGLEFSVRARAGPPAAAPDGVDSG
jgi:secretion/DNA translocation related TadE-like protein